MSVSSKGRELDHIRRLQHDIQDAKKAAMIVADRIKGGWEPFANTCELGAIQLKGFAKIIRVCERDIEQLEKDLTS